MAKAAELMRVVPTLVVPAAYVGLFSVGGGQVEARTFDADGAQLAVVGTWTPSFIPNSGPPDVQAIFLRGATEASLAGCSWAFVDGVADPDCYVIDLEAADLVAVATTHRPAVAGGQTILASVAVTGGFVYECGARTDTDETAQMIGYLRRISQDGQTITAIAASFNLFNDGQDRSIPAAPLMIEEDRWAVPTISLEGVPTNPGYVDTVTIAGSVGQIEDREVPEAVHGALPLGETSGSPLTRVALVGNEYVKQALFSIGGFTASGAGTLRDGGLIAFAADGSTRLCTYSGSHPITSGTTGPTIAFDTEEHGLVALDGL